ncbi:flagellar motor switch protein FliM [Gracilibacillus boraciitolerans JCM 21714]|uniref:Flagellar motor switch protein FliM n=1 Tax=Gracilibacillus boraciitolerans JCM 21714 TaxID=1298598 RepID=W4VDX9_9BACI|nr:flagellar motor switch protein FliM [Gracilibacillus boraciitolerans JCM 21714]
MNPQFLQLVSPNETVVVVSLDTTIGGDSSGMINICIPHVVLEPIIPKLSVHYWMQNENTKERKPEEYQSLARNIKQTSIDLSVILGETSITLEEFLFLGRGDTIMLNKGIDMPLSLMVDQEPKFYVQAGKQKQKLAVQVIEEIKGGGDEDDE